jgi:hypothetical protein
MLRRFLIFLGIFILICGFQSEIKQYAFLENPGFEGTTGEEITPEGWEICDSKTTPDILPGVYDVVLEPEEGKSFVGLVSRKNGEKETIGQKSKIKFEKGKCYKFSLSVSRSMNYLDFNVPLGLKIWAGSGPCLHSQLIHHEEVIDNKEWKEIKVKFVAEHNFNHLCMAVCNTPGIFFDYQGNVLMDNISKVEICHRT